MLKHQLRKYVNAVQMLRTEGAQVDGRFSFVNLSILLFIIVYFLLDLILYVSSTIFQLNRDGSSWVEPVLS